SSNALHSIRYMATVAECKFIFLDHLTLMVSELGDITYQNGDDLSKTDRLMSILRKLALANNVWIGLIVHLRKTGLGGVSFENGGIPSEDDLKGSGSIKQIANNVIALQRNRRHNNTKMKNTTLIHVLKSRLLGTVGSADYLYFDPETGRMNAIPNPG